jgi:hypothetical protein
MLSKDFSQTVKMWQNNITQFKTVANSLSETDSGLHAVWWDEEVGEKRWKNKSRDDSWAGYLNSNIFWIKQTFFI